MHDRARSRGSDGQADCLGLAGRAGSFHEEAGREDTRAVVRMVEADVEEATLQWSGWLGWGYRSGLEIAPGESFGEGGGNGRVVFELLL